MLRRVFALLLCLAALSARAEIAVVLNSGEGSISLLDTVAMREIKRFYIGKEPHHLMATPDDQYLIVANAVSNELVFLDPKSGEIKRRLGNISDPYQIGFSPDRKWFVSISLRLDRIDIYNGSDFSLVKRIALPKTPSHLAFNAASSLVFITLQESNEIAAIDLATQTVLWKIAVGKQPAGIWMTPDDKYLISGMTGDDHAEVIDWRERKRVKKIPTGKGAHNFLALGDGRHVFITNRVSSTINLIDQQTLTVVDTLNIPGGPDCLEVTRDGKQLWTTARWAQKVAVVDLASKKVIKEIPVGKSPHGIYFFTHAARK